MLYQIKKSLGCISAVVTDAIPQSGICVEFKNYDSQTDAAIVIYQDGKSEDVCINGYTFPCIYNNIRYSVHSDIYGGNSIHTIDFEFLDPSGSVQRIERKSIYGNNQAQAVEYFYSLLYNISCCENMEQIMQLYKYIIDNEWFSRDRERKAAVNVLCFIENFTPQLSKIEDTDYLDGLKHKINAKYKVAQDIISESNSPTMDKC